MSDIGPKAAVDVPIVILAGGLGTRLSEEMVVRPGRWSKSEATSDCQLSMSADPDLPTQLGVEAR